MGLAEWIIDDSCLVKYQFFSVAEVVFDRDGVAGEIRFKQEDENSPLKVTGRVTGLSPGLHGFHVHEFPNDGDNCTAAGGHYNPFDVRP